MKTVFKKGGSKSPTDYAVEVEAKEYIFREGDLGTEMYIIQDGQVEILRNLDGEERVLTVLDKGDFFGEMSVLEDLPRTASARALVRTRLLQINGSTFDQMLRGNPEIAVRMMRKLSRRLRETDALLEKGQRMAEGGKPVEAGPSVAEPTTATGTHSLLHLESGEVFRLTASSETTVGREDPVTGINPGIDLTEVDSQRSTSRRHAKIHRRGDKFFLTEEIGTTNGTFVNGVRAETGVPVELKVGDEVQFGLVKMKFQAD